MSNSNPVTIDDLVASLTEIRHFVAAMSIMVLTTNRKDHDDYVKKFDEADRRLDAFMSDLRARHD